MVSCPLQEALQIQFYPTMVLVSRDGKLLAREHGATDVTLPRMDRAIALALTHSRRECQQIESTPIEPTSLRSRSCLRVRLTALWHRLVALLVLGVEVPVEVDPQHA